MLHDASPSNAALLLAVDPPPFATSQVSSTCTIGGSISKGSRITGPNIPRRARRIAPQALTRSGNAWRNDLAGRGGSSTQMVRELGVYLTGWCGFLASGDPRGSYAN